MSGFLQLTCLAICTSSGHWNRWDGNIWIGRWSLHIGHSANCQRVRQVIIDAVVVVLGAVCHCSPVPHGERMVRVYSTYLPASWGQGLLGWRESDEGRASRLRAWAGLGRGTEISACGVGGPLVQTTRLRPDTSRRVPHRAICLDTGGNSRGSTMAPVASHGTGVSDRTESGAGSRLALRCHDGGT